MDNPTLLEVSLLVDGELAEAVAEVLARFIPSGVVIESTQIAPDPDGEGYVTGPLKVCGYLPVDTEVTGLRQKIEEALWYLGRIRPIPAPQFRPIVETNWVETWKEHYQPIPVGEKLVIVPAWLDPHVFNRVAVRIDPGMAFGTGTHPTTQLCLAVAERYLQPGQAVIDIGCGSGILSIASIKLGACHALAVDIDPLAVQATRQNAALNLVEASIEASIGSVAEVKSGLFSIRQAPLMFANILAPVLETLLSQGLGSLVTPNGIAILSGILAEQAESVEIAARQAGLSPVERLQHGDWVALAMAAP